jgi:hypothetical protein
MPVTDHSQGESMPHYDATDGKQVDLPADLDNGADNPWADILGFNSDGDFRPPPPVTHVPVLRPQDGP